nr:hypothetical protein [Desulfitobacterium hafniense]
MPHSSPVQSGWDHCGGISGDLGHSCSFRRRHYLILIRNRNICKKDLPI